MITVLEFYLKFDTKVVEKHNIRTFKYYRGDFLIICEELKLDSEGEFHQKGADDMWDRLRTYSSGEQG